MLSCDLPAHLGRPLRLTRLGLTAERIARAFWPLWTVLALTAALLMTGFAQLVAHAAKTRELGAGSIIGSGTVSNKQGNLHGSSIANGGVGYCCLAELRMYETIEGGAPKTPYLSFGDTVRIEESRPLSATKRWMTIRLIKRPEEV